MNFLVNRPFVVASNAITATRMDIISDGSSNSAVYTPGQSANLVLSDTNSLGAAGTTIMSIPQSSLQAGNSYPLGVSCSSGLAMTSVPPGVSVQLHWA